MPLSVERKQAKQADPTSLPEKRGRGRPRIHPAPLYDQANKPSAKMGRPVKISTPEELLDSIQNYFDSITSLKTDEAGETICDKNGEPLYEFASPPTYYGLALAIGIDVRTLRNYGGKEEVYPDFVPIVSRARMIVNEWREGQLFTRDGSKGAQYALSNTADGWADRQTIDVTTTHTVALPEQDVKALGAVIAQWQQLQSAAHAAQQIAGGPVIDVVAEPVEPQL